MAVSTADVVIQVRVSTDLEVPAWADVYAREWIQRLGLQHWRIHLQLALCVADDPDTRGLAEVHPNVHEATITLRADCADTPPWRRTIIHEMLHVAHGQIDQAVEQTIMSQVPEGARLMGHMLYTNVMEPYIHQLAHTLYRATCGIDYPEEYTTG